MMNGEDQAKPPRVAHDTYWSEDMRYYRNLQSPCGFANWEEVVDADGSVWYVLTCDCRGTGDEPMTPGHPLHCFDGCIASWNEQNYEDMCNYFYSITRAVEEYGTEKLSEMATTRKEVIKITMKHGLRTTNALLGLLEACEADIKILCKQLEVAESLELPRRAFELTCRAVGLGLLAIDSSSEKWVLRDLRPIGIAAAAVYVAQQAQEGRLSSTSLRRLEWAWKQVLLDSHRPEIGVFTVRKRRREIERALTEGERKQFLRGVDVHHV